MGRSASSAPRFFKINTNPYDFAFAFTDELPSPSKAIRGKLFEGERIIASDGYPADAKVRVAPGFGSELGGLVGNTHTLLIVSTPMKDAISRCVDAEVQYLPVSILDRRRRKLAQDYFVVNPIGQLDAMDRRASKIERSELGIVGIDELVLAGARVAKAPQLFRVQDDPETYLVGARLLRAWIDLEPRPKNVYVDEVRVTPAKPKTPRSR